MKTTVDLPDALAAEAREIARAQGTTLRELVIDGLHTAVESRKSHGATHPFSFVTVSGHGLVPGVEPSIWTELGYGLPS
ncbi:DUF2191 domain-containing protein [Microbacterium halophytorum]|uniref:DUF2191 domain-containing protein n=1 Tax=Microbacterium halophytorum TaxID=2067568 RepID=UPI000CFC68A9|nr:DUF2191 domain-containing protein [Microbacterium halophytorum]